jgi:large conductance mechanosensitive channel
MVNKKDPLGKQFKAFIKEQGVVGLAVGFLLGGAVSSVVKSLVEDIINPTLGIFLKSVDNLASLEWVVADSAIKYGHFLTVSLDFLIISLVVFYVVKVLGFIEIKK